MKILIFENEYTYIENAFNYVNIKDFNGNLNITVLPRSQDLAPFRDIELYDHVFIDISLSKNSVLDGFGILKKIKDENLNVKNITILTGNNNIEKRLSELGLDKYNILTKPVTFSLLKKRLTDN
jgi:DNA-binding response OmpR family regulator